MKTVEGFRLRTIGTDHVLMAEGANLINFNKMIAMNRSAAFLWEKVEGTEFTVQTLADLLIGEYGIDPALALEDSNKIASSWLEVGIISEN